MDKKRITQDYKIELIIKADVTKEAVKDWLSDSLFTNIQTAIDKVAGNKVVKLYSTDIAPIDRENPDYKWLSDMDLHDTNTKKS